MSSDDGRVTYESPVQSREYKYESPLMLPGRSATQPKPPLGVPALLDGGPEPAERYDAESVDSSANGGLRSASWSN